MAFGTCAIICAYNEEQTIESIVRQTKKYVDDVVVINDGSRDNTHQLAINGGANVIAHVTNQGKGKALKTGFDYFFNSKDYDRIVTLDADGQHLPESIPRFSEQIDKGYEAAIGKRDFSDACVPFARKWGNRLDSAILSHILKANIPDPQNGYRMYTRHALEKALKGNNNPGFTFELEMLIGLIKQRTNIAWVPIQTIYSNKIKSHIKPWKHIKDSLIIYKKASQEIY